MNGKNRKVRGCYSRVSRSFGFVPVPRSAATTSASKII